MRPSLISAGMAAMEADAQAIADDWDGAGAERLYVAWQGPSNSADLYPLDFYGGAPGVGLLLHCFVPPSVFTCARRGVWPLPLSSHNAAATPSITLQFCCFVGHASSLGNPWSEFASSLCA